MNHFIQHERVSLEKTSYKIIKQHLDTSKPQEPIVCSQEQQSGQRDSNIQVTSE